MWKMAVARVLGGGGDEGGSWCLVEICRVERGTTGL